MRLRGKILGESRGQIFEIQEDVKISICRTFLPMGRESSRRRWGIMLRYIVRAIYDVHKNTCQPMSSRRARGLPSVRGIEGFRPCLEIHAFYSCTIMMFLSIVLSLLLNFLMITDLREYDLQERSTISLIVRIALKSCEWGFVLLSPGRKHNRDLRLSTLEGDKRSHKQFSMLTGWI
ncbi:hypothetical protein SCHPADRAFT_911258 [Schizopora paradoxa]|uniref:Uncharacterized protein n=1 Tax=Schizopora paradoxa TaxID=27342 RepID=A0A0H2R077_9AGAM|nr:hypothetical protein SCHPADRAFT_911259 [Schizopora paradoxa]KLO05089.1 hypothetical protein SCHPADRAFT_911258 [Schizopora paradoxa]